MKGVYWTSLHSQDVQKQVHSFWRAIDVWWRKPHVINRRIVAAVEEHRFSGVSDSASPESLAELSYERPYEQWLRGLLVDFKQFAKTAAQAGNVTQLSFAQLINKHVATFKQSLSEILQQREQFPHSNNISNIVTIGKEHDEEKYATQAAEPELQVTELENCVSHVSGLLTENEMILPDETQSQTCVICIRKLLSKRASNIVVYEVGIFDYQQNEATFILLESGIREPSFPSYKFSYQDRRISLSVDDNYSSGICSSSIPSAEWLGNTLAPKVIKWASEDRGSHEAVGGEALVPMERYAELYQEMKQKYGAEFVKIWPENTDPKKFVYEDVAIATYLLLLFEEERNETGCDKKQSFVDLGCGNGLLVHILNSEGHPGRGIDLRRRKIWSLYGPETHLEESAVIASLETSFMDTDWLIGNHSDELTPWIPVMAARSSFSTRYFVLPCCFHDFDRKFSQRVAGQAQYRTYLDFVREAGETCGFKVEEDRMRIPSTKRVCHVGRRKTYPVEEHAQTLARIKEYVAHRCRKSNVHARKSQPSDLLPKSESRRTCESSSMNSGCSEDSEYACSHNRDIVNLDAGLARGQDAPRNLAPSFKPREVEEKVKNCTRVEKSLKDRIVMEVAWAILEDGGVKRSSHAFQGMISDSEDEGDTEWSRKVPRLWRRGGSITLGDAAKLFDRSTLKNLKSECGGLKTLLRNYNQVFEIRGNKVSLKDWSQITASEATKTVSSGGTSSKTALEITNSVPSNSSSSKTALDSTNSVSSSRDSSQTLSDATNPASINGCSSKTELEAANSLHVPSSGTSSKTASEATDPVSSSCTSAETANNPVSSSGSSSKTALEATGTVSSSGSSSMTALEATNPVSSSGTSSKTVLEAMNPVSSSVTSSKTAPEATNPVSSSGTSSMTAVDATNLVSSSGSSSMTASHKLDKKERERQQLYKTKLCWFHEHHPDGCPRVAEACPFAHGQAELRSRPAFGKS